MKKLASILLIACAVLISACEGPAGPPGNDGFNFVGTTFEFTGNFTAPDYELVFNFQENGFVPYESDVILAYILWKHEDGLDFWRPLPQTEYFNSGAILQYNYDFTADIPNDRIVDMAVFLDGDVELSTVPSDYRLDQTFRIVVVPSDFVGMSNVDVNDLNSIMNSPDIELKSLGKINLSTISEFGKSIN